MRYRYLLILDVSDCYLDTNYYSLKVTTETRRLFIEMAAEVMLAH